MDRIEEVKKIHNLILDFIKPYTETNVGSILMSDIDKLAQQIYELFEPKPNNPLARIWNEDGTSGIATGANKPDEGRLLTPEVITNIIETWHLTVQPHLVGLNSTEAEEKLKELPDVYTVLVEAQRDLTASIKDAECQQRVEQEREHSIQAVKEFQKKFPSSSVSEVIDLLELRRDTGQALKDQEKAG